MTEWESFTPETVGLIRRSIYSSDRCTTTRHYVEIARDADVYDGGGGSDG